MSTFGEFTLPIRKRAHESTFGEVTLPIRKRVYKGSEAHGRVAVLPPKTAAISTTGAAGGNIISNVYESNIGSIPACHETHHKFKGKGKETEPRNCFPPALRCGGYNKCKEGIIMCVH